MNSTTRQNILDYLKLCGKSGCRPLELSKFLSCDIAKAAKLLYRMWLDGDADRRITDFTTTRYYTRGLGRFAQGALTPPEEE